MSKNSGQGEKQYEKKLRLWCQKGGGECLKFYSAYSTGWLDRVILMPGGQFYPCEVKSDGVDLSPLQKARVKKLKRMGFTVLIVNSEKTLNETKQFLRDAIQK